VYHLSPAFTGFAAGACDQCAVSDVVRVCGARSLLRVGSFRMGKPPAAPGRSENPAPVLRLQLASGFRGVHFCSFTVPVLDPSAGSLPAAVWAENPPLPWGLAARFPGAVLLQLARAARPECPSCRVACLWLGFFSLFLTSQLFKALHQMLRVSG